MHRFAIQASVLFTLLWAGHVAAQEGPESRDTQKAIDRYKDYLARKPFHEFSFDKLVEAVVAKNELKPLTESYAQLVRDEPANRPAAIVLARLLARTEKLDDAVKLLESLTPVDAALARLRADLYLKRNDPKQAIQFYQMALEKPEDGKFHQEVYRSLSKATSRREIEPRRPRRSGRSRNSMPEASIRVSRSPPRWRNRDSTTKRPSNSRRHRSWPEMTIRRSVVFSRSLGSCRSIASSWTTRSRPTGRRFSSWAAATG